MTTTTMDAAKWTIETLQWLLSTGANISEINHLTNDLSQLRNSLPTAHLLIDRAEWGRFKNKGLEEQLWHLKDTTYNAGHLLREFDDQSLRQKLEKADRNMAGQLLSPSLNLLKSWITGSKKRVKAAQSNLGKAMTDIEGALNFMGLNVEPAQLMPETSYVIRVQVTGRNNDRDRVIERLGVPLTGDGISAGATRDPSTSRAKRRKVAVAIETNCIGDVSVLSIVGIGGVGKTTLAQFIFNDTRVNAHFNKMIWVCVSDLFDKKKITKEIIKSLVGREFDPSSSLDALHGELMKRLMSQKFLLVLDDVWENAIAEWESFFAPLRRGVEGSMVLVTTRCGDVANRVSTVRPVQLEGLPNHIFWEFFKKYAFDKERPESYPQLLEIGRKIAGRLCGSPLAAKTLGRLLNMDLTVRHWWIIQGSELWELPHKDNEILLALQLSYLYLPQELKRCFAVCSMFPKNYSFERDEIVGFWVAQGLVVAPGGNMRPEDIGSRYLEDLRSRSLFQADPRFPGQSRYLMHDLIHDMAQSVSVDECFLMQGLSNQRIMRQTVRHMSIEVDNEALSRMTCTNHLNKLHSLRFGTGIKCEISWFNQLSNIVVLSLRGCELVKLPEGICDLNHLRYLDISSSRIKELPEKFYRLYSLQFFDARSSELQTIRQGITKLVNLRHLALPRRVSLVLSRMSELGNLSALRELSYYTVGTNNGKRIGELKSMNQLSGSLCIKGIAKVRSVAEAAEARLIDKQYLKELDLQWHGVEPRRDVNRVLEALHPPPGIESLTVEGFGGDNFPPSWLNSVDLPTLRSLELRSCLHLRCLTGIDRMQHARLPIKNLTSLFLVKCPELTNVDQFLSPEYLPSIESIRLCDLGKLESLPLFGGFVCLQSLEIHQCNALVCTREMVLPPSLRHLTIYNCGELENCSR